MQPVVMAPTNFSAKYYGLNEIKEKDNRAEENTREKQKTDPTETWPYTLTKEADPEAPNPGEAVYGGEAASEAGEPLASRGVKPGGRQCGCG